MSFTTIFSVVSSFFQSTWGVTWKRRLILASGFVACLLLGISIGRFAIPARVETKEVEKIVTKVETRIEWKERIVYQKQKAETKVVYIDRVIEKDGTTREKIKEEIATKEETHKTDDKNKVESQTAQQSTEKIITKVVTNQPRWRLGVDVGWSWPTPKVNIYGPLILGVRADYRIVGGFAIGVFVNTSVAAGGSLSYSF